jgi:transcriptional regulator with XRE-family HTH domain
MTSSPTPATALSLQQLVAGALHARGLTERSFAQASGIPYQTIMGITRKAAVPRSGTLQTLAEQLGLAPATVQEAVARSRNARADTPATIKEPTVTAHDDSSPSLAQVVADAIVRGGTSVASFARTHDIPYVSLMKLINTGQPPRRKAVLDPLAKALGIGSQAFEAALAKSKANPAPAEAPRQSDNALNPFHAALLRLVEERKLTTKAFAEAADLSVLTAAKLLKRGELPGRATTHEKLRVLLGLTEIAYRDLLASSRSAETSSEEDSAIERRPSAPGYVAVSTGAAPASTTKGELFELIDRLSPAQLVALKNFLLSVL